MIIQASIENFHASLQNSEKTTPELLQNYFKNWSIFHVFDILSYFIKDFWVYLIDIGSYTYTYFNT